jgi:hypothetical protein
VDPDSESGSGSMRAKITHKNKNKNRVLKGWMFSFEAEVFSCSLNVLYGGLGKLLKLKILIKKYK